MLKSKLLFFINLFAVISSLVIITKCSSIPYPEFIDTDFIRFIFDRLSHGNTELQGLALSVLASYIFYFINVHVPKKRERHIVVNAINTYVTQLAYRSMCLIYLHQEVGGKVSKGLLAKVCKIISYDIEQKGNYVLSFSNHLELTEVIAVRNIMKNRKKFLMSHRKLDNICVSLMRDTDFLMKAYKSPLPHDNDSEWLEESSGVLSFKTDSNSFKLFIVELIEIDEDDQFMKLDAVGGYHRKYFVLPAISKVVDELKASFEQLKNSVDEAENQTSAN